LERFTVRHSILGFWEAVGAARESFGSKNGIAVDQEFYKVYFMAYLAETTTAIIQTKDMSASMRRADQQF
jgi:hypothetical protein